MSFRVRKGQVFKGETYPGHNRAEKTDKSWRLMIQDNCKIWIDLNKASRVISTRYAIPILQQRDSKGVQHVGILYKDGSDPRGKIQVNHAYEEED